MRFSLKRILSTLVIPRVLMLLTSANFYRKPLIKNNLVGEPNKRNKNLTHRVTAKNVYKFFKKMRGKLLHRIVGKIIYYSFQRRKSILHNISIICSC